MKITELNIKLKSVLYVLAVSVVGISLVTCGDGDEDGDGDTSKGVGETPQGGGPSGPGDGGPGDGDPDNNNPTTLAQHAVNAGLVADLTAANGMDKWQLAKLIIEAGVVEKSILEKIHEKGSEWDKFSDGNSYATFDDDKYKESFNENLGKIAVVLGKINAEKAKLKDLFTKCNETGWDSANKYKTVKDKTLNEIADVLFQRILEKDNDLKAIHDKKANWQKMEISSALTPIVEFTAPGDPTAGKLDYDMSNTDHYEFLKSAAEATKIIIEQRTKLDALLEMVYLERKDTDTIFKKATDLLELAEGHDAFLKEKLGVDWQNLDTGSKVEEIKEATYDKDKHEVGLRKAIEKIRDAVKPVMDILHSGSDDNTKQDDYYINNVKVDEEKYLGKQDSATIIEKAMAYIKAQLVDGSTEKFGTDDVKGDEYSKAALNALVPKMCDADDVKEKNLDELKDYLEDVITLVKSHTKAEQLSASNKTFSDAASISTFAKKNTLERMTELKSVPRCLVFKGLPSQDDDKSALYGVAQWIAALGADDPEDKDDEFTLVKEIRNTSSNLGKFHIPDYNKTADGSSHAKKFAFHYGVFFKIVCNKSTVDTAHQNIRKYIAELHSNIHTYFKINDEDTTLDLQKEGADTADISYEPNTMDLKAGKNLYNKLRTAYDAASPASYGLAVK